MVPFIRPRLYELDSEGVEKMYKSMSIIDSQQNRELTHLKNIIRNYLVIRSCRLTIGKYNQMQHY